MRRRRLLPEWAYDFWACDGRDGELTPRRDTIAEARIDQRQQQAKCESWQRCVWRIEWCLNERKLLLRVKALQRIATQQVEDRPWVNPRIIALEALGERPETAPAEKKGAAT